MKPWSAEHAAGKITRPLRHNGLPYSGVNVLMLWLEAEANEYSAPIWMTFKQAQELGGHVRKGEHGSLVVYANRLKKTETAKKKNVKPAEPKAAAAGGRNQRPERDRTPSDSARKRDDG